MADLATVDDGIVVNVKLMTENRVIERVLVLTDEVVDAPLRQQADVIFQIVFTLFR